MSEVDNQARIKKLESLYTKIKQRTEKTIVSDAEPESPTLGLQWFDTTQLAFKIWGGRAWETTTVKSLSVGTTPNWFRVDENGNMWSGRDTLALAQANTFAVLNTGQLYARNAYVRGDIQASSASFGYASSSSRGGAINSGFTSSNLSSVSNPTTGVKIDNSGIKMYSGGVQKVSLGADGNASFTGTITGSTIETFINSIDLVSSHISSNNSKGFWIDQAGYGDLIQITGSDYLGGGYVGKINFYKTGTFQGSIFGSNGSIQIDESNLNLGYNRHLYVGQSGAGNAYFGGKLKIPVGTNLY